MRAPDSVGRLEAGSLRGALLRLAKEPATVDFLRSLYRELAPLLREERGNDEDMVDLATVPPGKRRNYRAAREGEIVGAVKIARHWYAPRESYERWLASIAVRPSTAPHVEEPGVSNLDAMRQRLGLNKRSA